MDGITKESVVTTQATLSIQPHPRQKEKKDQFRGWIANTAQHGNHSMLKICRYVRSKQWDGWKLRKLAVTRLTSFCKCVEFGKFLVVSFEGTKRSQISKMTYRISGDHSSCGLVIVIVQADISIDIQDSGVCTTGASHCCDTKCAAIGVVT